MAVALGEGEVKTLEDLAGLVPDDIRGYYETKDGERVREPGILDEPSTSRPRTPRRLIMRARVAAGWIEPEALSSRRSWSRTSSPRKTRRSARPTRRPRRCSRSAEGDA